MNRRKFLIATTGAGFRGIDRILVRLENGHLMG